ncbi:hypothetical protein Sjap_022273 [Stephania japonica]|uniref:Uncharacterized protein n=1 Tax=Stephania japonica TaxID=461633 RepID=A0AAP0EP32_9MAGN
MYFEWFISSQILSECSICFIYHFYGCWVKKHYLLGRVHGGGRQRLRAMTDRVDGGGGWQWVSRR